MEQVDSRVLDWILNFHQNRALIKEMFRDKYQYHFANMLRSTFMRGTVALALPSKHIVWCDNDNRVAYDIDGKYSVDALYYIPVKDIGQLINNYRAITGLHVNATDDDYINIVKKYCEGNNIEYNSTLDIALKSGNNNSNSGQEHEQEDETYYDFFSKH